MRISEVLNNQFHLLSIFSGKKKGASLKLSGVAVNAHSVLKAEKDLEPLAASLPSDEKQLKSFRLTVPTRSVHWGITWGIVEDSMLLVGILLYGMGNWEAIKNDHTLKLTNKVRNCNNSLFCNPLLFCFCFVF